MPFTKTHIKLVGCTALLAACANQTSIQDSYISNRDACQTAAEQNIGRFSSPGEETDIRTRNAKLVTLFSDCMFEQGWTVATPEHGGEQETAKNEDDLQQLNDVKAGAAAAAKVGKPAPVAATPSTAASTATPLDSGRRVPSQQFEQ